MQSFMQSFTKSVNFSPASSLRCRRCHRDLQDTIPVQALRLSTVNRGRFSLDDDNDTLPIVLFCSDCYRHPRIRRSHVRIDRCERCDHYDFYHHGRWIMDSDTGPEWLCGRCADVEEWFPDRFASRGDSNR